LQKKIKYVLGGSKMPFSLKTTLPILRCQRNKNKTLRTAVKKPKVRYCVHWAYPVAFVAVIVFFVTVYLCQCAQLISVQYRVGDLKNLKTTLLTEQRNLKLAIEKLESLERIEKIAHNDLNMIAPARRHILSLKSPTSVAQLTVGDDSAGAVR
jgi:cell division protein FtsL